LCCEEVPILLNQVLIFIRHKGLSFCNSYFRGSYCICTYALENMSIKFLGYLLLILLLPFISNGQTCSGKSANININGDPSATAICEGSSLAVALGKLANGYIDPVYQWQERVGDAADFHDIPGATGGIHYLNITSAVRGGYSYRVKVAENGGGCPFISDPLDINVIPAPVASAGEDLTVPEGKSVRLDGNASGSGLTYLWSPALYLDDPTSPNPVATPPEDILYTLRVTNSCGSSVTDDVFITVFKDLGIPTTFTPNGDGVNDLWNISGLAFYPDARVSVFNRYGALIFSSQGYDSPWDGTYNGQYLSQSVYYYLIDLKNEAKVYSGSITILK
jgi:gliding motility-associated-like protein